MQHSRDRDALGRGNAKFNLLSPVMASSAENEHTSAFLALSIAIVADEVFVIVRRPHKTQQLAWEAGPPYIYPSTVLRIC